MMNFRYLYNLFVLFCFLVLLLLVLKYHEEPEPVDYRGTMRAIDGDTLAWREERLRLAGIDAPELHQTCELGADRWQCGYAARDLLQKLTNARDLVCKPGRRDKYRRVLATCVAGGIEINREMVLSGLAVDYGRYQAEAAEAKHHRRGLWESRFERPEVWRRNRAALEPGAEEAIDDFLSSLRRFFGVH